MKPKLGKEKERKNVIPLPLEGKLPHQLGGDIIHTSKVQFQKKIKVFQTLICKTRLSMCKETIKNLLHT